MKTTLVTALLALLCLTVSGQSGDYVEGFQIEIFNGWGPNPKTDAMGRADVAVGGAVSSLFRNPAGIGLIEKAEFDFSTAGQFYALSKSDAFFTGAAYRIHDRFIAALSYQVFAVGETTFGITFGPDNYTLDKGRSANLTVSASGEPVKNLHIGLNFNTFFLKYIEEIKTATAVHLDAGVLYAIHFGPNKVDENQGVRIGASVTNITNASIEFFSPDDDRADNKFPIIARYAVAYFNDQLIEKTSASGKSYLGMTATFEAQDYLNSDFTTAFRVGTEFIVYEILAFRMGWFRESADAMGSAANQGFRKGITYGFGLIVPLEDLTKGKAPLDIHFDYASFNQPTYRATGGSFISNMRAFGLRAVFTMNHLDKKSNQ